MARYIFQLPDIGEGIAQAEIVSWHVQLGSTIEEDAPLADMMTDKATVEIESPVAGTIVALGGGVGDMVAIGAPLVVIETCGPLEDDAEPHPAAGLDREIPRSAYPGQSDTKLERPGPPIASSGARSLASPPVRARARRLGIDLAWVTAGDSGVIGHEDLDAFLLARARPAGVQDEPPAAPSKPVITGAGEEVRVLGLRRRIAENMAAAKRHIPHFTYVEEIDVTDLETLRARINSDRAGMPAMPRLTMLPFLVSAVCRVLPVFPMINARFEEEAGVVTRYASVHLGIATQTEAGLMVPVLRDAQNRTLSQIAAEIARLATAAREGRAASQDLSGSTLTITSLGQLGGIATTPVINRPEVAIIGPNRIVERPVFVSDGAGGEVVVKRKLMNVSISCDHRVVDGWDAASFLQAIKRMIEAPNLLLAI